MGENPTFSSVFASFVDKIPWNASLRESFARNIEKIEEKYKETLGFREVFFGGLAVVLQFSQDSAGLLFDNRGFGVHFININ